MINTYVSKKRIYTLNEDFFSEIDNEIKAYWLGFIYADGNISIRKQGQNCECFNEFKKTILI